VDGIVEEYRDILSSPIVVPIHYQVKHPIDLTPDAPLPNGPFYLCSLMENDEIMVTSERFFKRGTSDPAPPLAEAQLYRCRRRTGLGDSALIIEP
jgi:hypothetical protein